MGTPTNGLDTSSNNHSARSRFNWSEALAAGYTFTINKCTEGITYVNPFYNGPAGTDANDAAGAGLHTGAYHYAHPEINSPQAEAKWFNAHVGNPQAKWLDLESGMGSLSDQDLANWAVIFMGETDCTGVYWDLTYRDHLWHLMKPSDVANRLQWVAAPSVDEWPTGAWIWQYGTGAIPGIGVVDLNRSIVLP